MFLGVASNRDASGEPFDEDEYLKMLFSTASDPKTGKGVIGFLYRVILGNAGTVLSIRQHHADLLVVGVQESGGDEQFLCLGNIDVRRLPKETREQVINELQHLFDAGFVREALIRNQQTFSENPYTRPLSKLNFHYFTVIHLCRFLKGGRREWIIPMFAHFQKQIFAA